MKFNTIDDAKKYVVSATNKTKSIEQIYANIIYFQKMADESHDEESRNLCLSKVSELNQWKHSDDFKNGNYPQGIDDLVIELIEWRSTIHAFQNVDVKRDLFKESGFYAQWYIGAIYGIFSIFGKLLSKDSRDNSLRKLWKNISPIMLSDCGCTKEEVNHINTALDEKSGRFTNKNSRALLFRNKLISHNEAMPIVSWKEVDKDIAFLIRIWSLLTSWSSFGLFEPFRTDEQAFLGIESMLDSSEINNLRKKRQEYLKKVMDWSKRYTHTGETDPGRGAFSSLSVTVSVITI